MQEKGCRALWAPIGSITIAAVDLLYSTSLIGYYVIFLFHFVAGLGFFIALLLLTLLGMYSWAIVGLVYLVKFQKRETNKVVAVAAA